jgi:hypothetical protein
MISTLKTQVMTEPSLITHAITASSHILPNSSPIVIQSHETTKHTQMRQQHCTKSEVITARCVTGLSPPHLLQTAMVLSIHTDINNVNFCGAGIVQSVSEQAMKWMVCGMIPGQGQGLLYFPKCPTGSRTHPPVQWALGFLPGSKTAKV